MSFDSATRPCDQSQGGWHRSAAELLPRRRLPPPHRVNVDGYNRLPTRQEAGQLDLPPVTKAHRPHPAPRRRRAVGRRNGRFGRPRRSRRSVTPTPGKPRPASSNEPSWGFLRHEGDGPSLSVRERRIQPTQRRHFSGDRRRNRSSAAFASRVEAHLRPVGEVGQHLPRLRRAGFLQHLHRTAPPAFRADERRPAASAPTPTIPRSAAAPPVRADGPAPRSGPSPSPRRNSAARRRPIAHFIIIAVQVRNPTGDLRTGSDERERT